MGSSISRDTPLADLTLRKYESPKGLEERELVRKLMLSIGLLQPGDSRDVIVDIFLVFLKNPSQNLSAPEIEKLTIEYRKAYNLALLGIASSNIRRQILRLRDAFLVEKVGNEYRINENATLSEILSEKIEKYYLKSIMSRVKEYFGAVDEIFLKS